MRKDSLCPEELELNYKFRGKYSLKICSLPVRVSLLSPFHLNARKPAVEMGIQRCNQNLLKSVKVLKYSFKNRTPVVQMSEKYPTINERKAFTTNSLFLILLQ